MADGSWYDPSLLDKCGVYEVLCPETSKAYVGCSNQISIRIAVHHKQLSEGKHATVELQADYNQWGENAFLVSVLIECAAEERFQYEQAVIQYRIGRGEKLYNHIKEPRKLRVIEATPIQSKFRQLLKDNPRVSYQNLADQLRINKTTLWRFLNTDYEPKDKKIRDALGLHIEPEITYIRQERGENGRFK